MDDESLVIVPVPSLVSTLLRREKDKGAPLTEQEVLSIRDSCPSIAMTVEQEKAVEEGRGYVDIDPERRGNSGKLCGSNSFEECGPERTSSEVQREARRPGTPPPAGPRQ